MIPATALPLHLPVDRQGRMARMVSFPGFPDAGAFRLLLAGWPDRDRLVEAVRTVSRSRHPIIGCRLEHFGAGLFYRWRPTPFDRQDYLHPGFERLRPFPYYQAPPFRLHVDDRSLTFEWSHLAMDGVGMFILMQSVLAQYAHGSEPLPALCDEVGLRRRGDYFGTKPEVKARNPARLFVDRPSGQVLARKADGLVPTGAAHGRGTRLFHLKLPQAALRARAKALGGTVTGLLGGGVLTQIVRWNHARGARARFLSIDMPVNLRPDDERRHLVANVTGLITINLEVERPDVSLVDMVGKVSSELATAIEQNRAWDRIWFRRATVSHPMEAPLALLRGVTRLIERPLVERAPTVLLSNMGRHADLVGPWGGLGVEGLEIIGTAFSPFTINMASAGTGETVLSMAVRRSLFSEDTLARFADELRTVLLEAD